MLGQRNQRFQIGRRCFDPNFEFEHPKALLTTEAQSFVVYRAKRAEHGIDGEAVDCLGREPMAQAQTPTTAGEIGQGAVQSEARGWSRGRIVFCVQSGRQCFDLLSG
jgi:hypothetical protein